MIKKVLLKNVKRDQALPEKLEQLMLGSSDAYKNAIKLTGNKTLPDPMVAFDILSNWPAKSNAAYRYESQKKNLKKFFLWPHPEDSIIHFSAFDREYYHEID